MSTVPTEAVGNQGKGCSSMVAGMVATLAFVVGLLMGAGGFFGYVKNYRIPNYAPVRKFLWSSNSSIPPNSLIRMVYSPFPGPYL